MAVSTARPTHDWRPQPWAERVIATLMVVALAAPGLATAVGLGRDAQRDEAPAPQAGGVLASTAAAFDGRFAYRAWFVTAQARLREALFGVSPLPTVWRGRDGWWYLAADGAVEDTLNESPLSAADLEAWCTTLQHTYDWLRGRGIAYVFVVAPDKPTIYPEHLPASLHPRPGTTRTDQLVTALTTRTTVPLIDLRPVLLAAKHDGPLFHLTDTHWNDVGAALAYRQVLGALAGRVPGLAPAAGDDAFTLTPTPQPGGDLASMLGLSSALPETERRLVPRRPRRARTIEPPTSEKGFGVPRMVTVVDDATLPRAVVYRDSFGSALIPFLAEHFQRMVVLWEYDVVPATIREERPQVVIHEWVGRRLHTRLPYDAIAADAAAAADLTRSALARR